MTGSSGPRPRPERGPPPPKLAAVRWIVDGMNVIGTRPDAWWRDRHAAMVRLLQELERRARPPIRSTVIEIAHAPRPRRDSADDEIVRLLMVDEKPETVRVVTSD